MDACEVGVPKGIPEGLQATTLTHLRRYRHYFALVKIESVGSASCLPVMSAKDKQGTRRWRSDLQGTYHVMNMIDISNCEMFHGVVFAEQVLYALVWTKNVCEFNSGRLIQSLYKRRKQVKKTNPAEANCLKVSFGQSEV